MATTTQVGPGSNGGIRDLTMDFLKADPTEAPSAAAAAPSTAAPPEGLETKITTPEEFLSRQPSAPPSPAPEAIAPIPPEPDSPFPEDVSPIAPPATPEAPATPAAPTEAEKEEQQFQAEIAKFDPKQKAAILKERAHSKQLREELEAVRAQLKKAPVAPAEDFQALNQQLEQVKARNTELEEKIGQLDLSQSPTFRATFDDKINGLAARAAKQLVDEGVDAKEARQVVMRALSTPKASERENMVAEVAPGVTGTMAAFFTQIDELRENRQVALQNWRQTRVAQDEQAKTAGTFSFRQRIKQDVSKGLEMLRADKNGFYMESSKSPEWNAKVQQRIAMVEGILQRQDPEQIVRLVMDGITAPDFRKLYSALNTKYNALVAELNRRDARNLPFTTGGRPPVGPAPAGAKISGDTVEEAASAFLRM